MRIMGFRARCRRPSAQLCFLFRAEKHLVCSIGALPRPPPPTAAAVPRAQRAATAPLRRPSLAPATRHAAVLPPVAAATVDRTSAPADAATGGSNRRVMIIGKIKWLSEREI